jgi:hypothetical protein
MHRWNYFLQEILPPASWRASAGGRMIGFMGSSKITLTAEVDEMKSLRANAHFRKPNDLDSYLRLANMI